MNLVPYRLVLGQPGLRMLMVIGFLARVPATAVSMVMTLHVVTTLELGYAEAGLAGALGMAGAGVGSPLAGRLIDRLGARPVILVTTVAQAGFWVLAPGLGYEALVLCAFVAGIFSLPVFGLMRQYLAAMVGTDHRRTAFALDSMAVEVSFMLGPALGVAGVTGLGSSVTMYALAAGMLAAGVSLFVLNAPITSAEERAEAAGMAPRRRWLTRSMVVLLVVTAATTVVLAATELSVVAVLRERDATAWTGLVIAVWCAYSLIGGFVFGALRRSPSPLLLVAALGAFTIPVGLVGGGWWWLMLALVPAGLLCAPSLAASVETVSAWVPASARGEAMGLHGAALTVGIAAGAPAAGALIDALGPSWGFALGGFAVLAVLAAVPVWPHRHPKAAMPVWSGAKSHRTPDEVLA
jgi:MFS family permease